MDLHEALRIDADAHALATRAAQWIGSAAKDSIASQGKFTVALTGGTSPLEAYSILAAEPYRSGIDWARVHVFWGDERAVPPDRPESNFGAANERLISKVPLPAANVHRMQGERRDLEQAAAEYEADVRRVVTGDPVPVFDMILVGVGGDGHVLSLYPGCPQIFAATGLVVALREPPMNPALSRITFTPPLLEAARRVMVLAPGAAKAAPLAALIDGPYDPRHTPAMLVRGAHGEVQVLADVAAAVSVLKRA